MADNVRINYMYCAEDVYKTFKTCKKADICTNTMAALTTQACEMYLKHIIMVGMTGDRKTDYFFIPVPKDVLHSLDSLYDYIQKSFVVQPNKILEDNLRHLSEFYKQRYPSYKSYIISRAEMDKAEMVMDTCREFTAKSIQTIRENARQNHELTESIIESEITNR